MAPPRRSPGIPTRVSEAFLFDPSAGTRGPEPGQVAIGIAYPVGQVETRKGIAATLRLVIGKEELEGRWICIGRMFVRLGEATEELRPCQSPTSCPSRR